MKFTAKLVLQELPGRKFFNVQDAIQAEKDYFLALEIVGINDQTITTTKSAFDILQKSFPSLKVNNEEIKIVNAVLPPGAKDVPHATVFHTPDFRINRELTQVVDMDKVKRAKDIVADYNNSVIEFDVPDAQAFEFVSTSPQYYSLINTTAKVTVAASVGGKPPFVGPDRDGILEIAIPEKIKNLMLVIGRQICKDSEYEVWGQNKNPVGYHITIGQTSGLNLKLEAAAKAATSNQLDEDGAVYQVNNRP